MQDTASEANNIPYGADVLDHNKNDIGNWYSTANSTIIRIIKDGKGIIIYTPSASGSSGGGGGSGGSGGGK
ncbi:MAG: hypothetical protein SRB1_01066 [Desulfobacteraceae bacterium Eth-SRB1]|nr:MAG: hypothetical protein SRB1_01066 [Desulfobacteraceae bacterium Eth-SRB1]